MSKSAAPVERERLLPPSLVLTITAMVGIGLALIFPRETLRERLLGQGRSMDGLTVAYLEAWLKAAPDDPGFMTVLAEQYARSGKLDAAEALLARMEAIQGTSLAPAILRTRIDIALQRAWASQPETPARARFVAEAEAMLRQAAARRWTIPELQSLARQARELGAMDLLRHFYRELASADPANAAFWNKQMANIVDSAGGDSNYRELANALFRKLSSAVTVSEQRALFMKGLRTLQSGNLLDEALAAAEQHGGPLLDDPEVLRYLARLALAANRPELAARYVTRLIRLSAGHPAPLARAANATPWTDHGIVFLDGPRGLALRRTLAAAGLFHVRKAATPNAAIVDTGSGAASAISPEDYDLAYRVFQAAGKLDQAQRTAEAAVNKWPLDLAWRQRLAQVAEWNRQPAVALQQWLAYAQASNDEHAWNQVLRLAPGLSDDVSYLAALRHRLKPGDLPTIDAMVDAYERLGEPDRAMALLDSLSHGPNARQVLERNGALAERAGKDDRAVAIYEQLQRRFGPRPDVALKLANLHYAHGRMKQALDALLAARGSAGTDEIDTVYWRTLAALAKLMQRDDLLPHAYRQLVTSISMSREAPCRTLTDSEQRDDCEEEHAAARQRDMDNLLAFYERWPLDAGRIAEADWRRSGSTGSLEAALSYYGRAGAWSRAGQLLEGLNPAQKAAAEQSPRFLAHRADYWRALGKHDGALADLRRAARLPRPGGETLAALLWAEVDLGTDEELRAAMRQLKPKAKTNPELWAPFAAAHMRFQDGRSALHYLQKLDGRRQADPLWAGLTADAYESIGQPDTAWRLRRAAWAALHRDRDGRAAPSATRSAEDRRTGLGEADVESARERRTQMVTLGRIFASGDVSRALVIQMLRDDRSSGDGGQMGTGSGTALRDIAGLPSADAIAGGEAARAASLSAAARETALAWAMSIEENALARAWLAKHYTRALIRPAYADIALALDRNDLETVDRVLERQRGRVPLSSETGANMQLGRLATAQTQAFEAQQRAQSDDTLQQTLQDALLYDAQAIAPSVIYARQRPLAYTESAVAGGVRLGHGYDLGLAAAWREQHSTDTGQLANVPASDRRAGLTLGYRDNNRRWQLTVGYREGLERLTTARIFGEWNRQGRLQFDALAGLNQIADESVALRLGGAKDVLGMGVSYRASLREFAGLRVEYSRFHGQDGSTLGQGVVYDVEVGYRIRTAFPDYTVRLVGTHGRYGTSGNDLTKRMATLVPDGHAATPAFYMPEDFTQAGVVFGFGTVLLEDYTRKWRPFGEVGLLHDTRAGQNVRLQLGVAGSVVGNDHVALYVSRETAARNGGAPLTQVGLRYRWLY